LSETQSKAIAFPVDNFSIISFISPSFSRFSLGSSFLLENPISHQFAFPSSSLLKIQWLSSALFLIVEQLFTDRVDCGFTRELITLLFWTFLISSSQLALWSEELFVVTNCSLISAFFFFNRIVKHTFMFGCMFRWLHNP